MMLPATRRYPDGKPSRFPSKGTVYQRFMVNVRTGPDCWEWTGSRFKDRYGQPSYGYFWMDGAGHGAHTVMAQWWVWPIPGMQVNHRCNNRICVRPTHLYWGTQQQNVDDKYAT